MIPYLDPAVKHVSASRLRKLTAEQLKGFHETWVLQDHDEPLAVLLPYATFVEMSEQLRSPAKIERTDRLALDDALKLTERR